MSDNVVDIGVHPKFSAPVVDGPTAQQAAHADFKRHLQDLIDTFDGNNRDDTEEELLIPPPKKAICIECKHAFDTRGRWKQFWSKAEAADLTCSRAKLQEMPHPVTGETLYVSPIPFAKRGVLRPTGREYCILLNSKGECTESEPVE